MKINVVLTELVARLLFVASICSVAAILCLKAILSSPVVLDFAYRISCEITRFENWFG